MGLVSYYRHSVRGTGTVDSTWAGCPYDATSKPHTDECVEYYYGDGEGVLSATKLTSTYHIGIMYGRLPNTHHTVELNFDDTAAVFAGEREIAATGPVAPLFYLNDVAAPAVIKDIIWDETVAQAKQRFIDSGGTQEAADNIFTFGGHGFHVIRDDTPYFVGVYGQGTNELISLDAVKNHMSCGPPIFQPGYNIVTSWFYGQNGSPIDRPHWGVSGIWAAIQNSQYWQSVVAPFRNAALSGSGALQSSRVDMIPYGIGVCPSRTGSLVGVIRTGGQVWFVWRKTDESFEDEGIIRHTGSGQAHLSFQSRNPDGRLEHYSEGEYRQVNGSTFPNAYDSDGTDQFTSAGSRKLISVGRDVEIQDAGSSGL
jgi:hypothetical protein